MLGERKLVLWIPDWSLAAVNVSVPPGSPAATVHRGRIASTTRLARSWGVRRGLRQASAMQICPELIVLPHDPDRDEASFEAVLQIFDSYLPEVQALKPGLAWAPLPTKKRWGEGEEEILHGLSEDLVEQLGIEALFGIANGMGTAVAAAQQGKIIAPEQTEKFLQSLSLKDLVTFLPASRLESTISLLHELGVNNVTKLHDLGRKQILTRFGKAGEELWCLSQGGDLSLLGADTQTCYVEVKKVFDEPAFELNHVLMDLKAVSVQFVNDLRKQGLNLEQAMITVTLSTGIERCRKWLFFGKADSTQVLSRVLWQVRAWQDEPDAEALLESVSVKALSVSAATRTGALWGEAPRSETVNLTVSQIQMKAGEESVLVPHLQGGLNPRERTVLIPWGKEVQTVSSEGEWVGSVHEAPSVLFEDPIKVKVLGASSDGTWGPIWLERRGLLSGIPERVLIVGENSFLQPGPYKIAQVGSIWPQRGAWWNQESPKGYVRLGIEREDDFLLVWRGQWFLEGVYSGVK